MAGMGFTSREAGEPQRGTRYQLLESVPRPVRTHADWSVKLLNPGAGPALSVAITLGPTRWSLPIGCPGDPEASFVICPVCKEGMLLDKITGHIGWHADQCSACQTQNPDDCRCYECIQGRVSARDEEAKKARLMSESLDQLLLAAEAQFDPDQADLQLAAYLGRFWLNQDPDDSRAPGSTYNGAVVAPLPTTKADDETDAKRRRQKYEKLKEEFVRTEDPVVKAAMLQCVEQGPLPLTPRQQTNLDIADYLAGQGDNPAHPHYNSAGTRFLYNGARCTKTCPCYLKPSRPHKNLPCQDCGKRHAAGLCPEAWRKKSDWGMAEAPLWPPIKYKLCWLQRFAGENKALTFAVLAGFMSLIFTVLLPAFWHIW